METISEKLIEKKLAELDAKSEEEMPSIINEMSEKQPYLLIYLLAASEQLDSDFERELFFYMGVSIWLIMSEANKKSGRLSEKVLDKKEKQNEYMLKYLEGEDAEAFNLLARQILAEYNQPHLLNYVMETIFEDEEPELDEGIFFFYLKTIIDALDS